MSKRGYWLTALGLLSLAVVMVIAVLAYLLLTLPAVSNQASLAPHRPTLNLPTAPPPTATPGPRLPDKNKILFLAEKPIRGYSNCNAYGFRGIVMTDNDDPLPRVQIVVWDDVNGLVALDTTGSDGGYLIEIEAEPSVRNLWVQVYQNDLPVSEPVLVKTQIDCQQGFQVYQVNWRELAGDH